MMKKLLAALLFSTPLAVALPAAAKFQAYGPTTPAAEKSDEDKMTPEKEKKEFQVSDDDDKDKSKGDEEKKEFKVSDDEDKDKSKGDDEKKEFKVSIDENDYDKLDRPAGDPEKKQFQA